VFLLHFGNFWGDLIQTGNLVTVPKVFWVFYVRCVPTLTIRTVYIAVMLGDREVGQTGRTLACAHGRLYGSAELCEFRNGNE
jgi:hypothetical protein